MLRGTDMSIRLATSEDAPGIAALHADSWRRHYRGAYADQYLGADLDADRLVTWSQRLGLPSTEHVTFLAERHAELVGFAHVIFDADPTWGALVENLHVVHSLHRTGIGTELLAAAARVVIDSRPASPMFLWVLEQNTRAQAFYLARNGWPLEREPAAPPRGDARNLNGTPMKMRVAWQDPAILLQPATQA